MDYDPRSFALTQLHFTAFTVIDLQQNLHPIEWPMLGAQREGPAGFPAGPDSVVTRR
jgi:hypothetical protein